MATRDRTARGVEIGAGTVAGGVGTALTAEKLRDAYKKDYPHRYGPAAEHVERAAGEVAPKAGRVARTLSEGHVRFPALATGTAAVALATGAKKYRKHREHAAAREPVGKGALEGTVLKIPKRGYIKGIGQVRVMHYHGNGHFMVLDRSDTKRLVHRDKITFSKAAPGPGDSAFGVPTVAKKDDTPVGLKITGRFDDAVRTIKNKAVPPTGKLIAVGVDRSKQAVQQERQKLGKADTRRRAARTAEVGAGAGATAAAVGSVGAQRAGRQFAHSATREAKSRDRAYTSATRHSAGVAADLNAYADAVKVRHGRGVTAEALRETEAAHRVADGNIASGQFHHFRAIHDASRASGELRRARNLRAGAVGLAAVGYGAHRAAGQKRKP